MNRLRYTTFGGNAVEAEDFEWLQNATKESFKLLMKAQGVSNNEYMILFGCEVPTPGNITAGAVVIDGEPMAVDAQVLPALTGSDIHYFNVVETADPSGNEPLESGGTTDQYIIRKAEVVAGTPIGSYLALNGKRYYSEEDWHYVGYPGEIGYDNGAFTQFMATPPAVHPIFGMRFRKTKNNRLELGGRVTIPVASYGLNFATLPVDYRPNYYAQFPAILWENGGNAGELIKTCLITINSAAISGVLIRDGLVQINNANVLAINTSVNITVFLDGISIPLER